MIDSENDIQLVKINLLIIGASISVYRLIQDADVIFLANSIGFLLISILFVYFVYINELNPLESDSKNRYYRASALMLNIAGLLGIPAAFVVQRDLEGFTNFSVPSEYTVVILYLLPIMVMGYYYKVAETTYGMDQEAIGDVLKELAIALTLMAIVIVIMT